MPPALERAQRRVDVAPRPADARPLLPRRRPALLALSKRHRVRSLRRRRGTFRLRPRRVRGARKLLRASERFAVGAPPLGPRVEPLAADLPARGAGAHGGLNHDGGGVAAGGLRGSVRAPREVLRVGKAGDAAVVVAAARRVAAEVALDDRRRGGLDAAPRRGRGVLLLSIRVATRGRALRRLARAPRLRGRGRRLEAALTLVLLPGRHREEVADDAHELRLGQLAHARLRDVRQEVDLRAALLHRAERVRLRPGEVHAAARAGRGGAREDARRHRRGGKATATSDERLCDTRRHRTARRCFPRAK